MEQVILIDTNVISRYFNDSLNDDLVLILETSNFKISVITRIELLSWDKYNTDQLNIISDFIFKLGSNLLTYVLRMTDVRQEILNFISRLWFILSETLFSEHILMQRRFEF